ncbi:MAG: OsmC family protein [Desulfosarcina sp.]|nr:OsmC family protein [Desulfobacterales bacterium]
MMGTLATVLAGHKIRTFGDHYHADVSGDIENIEGVLKITRIHVHYHLKAPPKQWEQAREAMRHYITLCPGAQSVIGCIQIRDELTLEPPE